MNAREERIDHDLDALLDICEKVGKLKGGERLKLCQHLGKVIDHEVGQDKEAAASLPEMRVRDFRREVCEYLGIALEE